MQNNSYTPGSSVYPGEYIPRYKEHDFGIVQDRHKKKVNEIPANINESRNFYKVELAIPGIERENIFVKICENVLSVSIIYDNEPGKQRGIQLHEFTSNGYVSRKIVLPDNADPLFLSAEYKSGILQLHIPKSKHPAKPVDAKIAIY
jgi:HSP20 family protein